jgi:DNA topoisomerase-1
VLAKIVPLRIPPLAAKAARLRYVSCSEQGIRRVRRGRSFVYFLPNGAQLRDERELTRIRALALPPAWKNVWICLDPRGHLQATGIDARGRKQYRYDARWRSVRDEAKFHELLDLAELLPVLRRRVARDLTLPGLPRDKVLAAIVSIMERTQLRVGNDRYTQQNGSYGLTTLLDRHARIRGSRLELCFRGKGGKARRVELVDERLSRIVRRCRDLPGQRLFQYIDERGGRRWITSSDVNEYLQRVTGAELTAKIFRTWKATLLAANTLESAAVAASARESKRIVNETLGLVAEQLGNTPAICRKSYVDPRVFDAYLSGSLGSTMARARRRHGLTLAECRLVSLLERALRERKAARERNAA